MIISSRAIKLFWVFVLAISVAGMFYLGTHPKDITRWWAWLASYNVMMSFLAGVFIFRTILRLKRQTTDDILGANLTWTFVKIIPVIAILPLISFYLFSFESLQDSVENIKDFSTAIQERTASSINALTEDVEALKLEKYRDRSTVLLNIVRQNNSYDADTPEYQQRMQTIAEEIVHRDLVCQMMVLDSEKRLIAQTDDLPQCPRDKATRALYETPSLSLYEYINTERQNRVIEVRMSNRYLDNDADHVFHLLLFYLADTSTTQFLDKLAALKNTRLNIQINLAPIRRAFLLDMSTTMLLVVLGVLLIVFKMIDAVMLPLNHLSKATKQVSQGNYEVHIEHPKNDDMRPLIEFFNQMALEIKHARDSLATQKVYLETILQYSYGVIALDERYQVKIVNSQAQKILNMQDLSQVNNQIYEKIGKIYPETQNLIAKVSAWLQQDLPEYSETIELSIDQTSVLLSCQGAKLTDQEQALGYVIIIKDITQLREAQNKAAWSAVARKMAHEVKNPLTPILLSAQRLRNKLLAKLNPEDAQVIDKTTNTIMQQVKSMDAIISAFAQYTKSPVLNKQMQSLNTIIQDASELYDSENEVQINLNLADDLPDLLLDADSIQRLLINLIKNSIEAIRHLRAVQIDISSYFIAEERVVVLMLNDNGNGFSDDVKDRIFEPYITTKLKGGGLGMAIVANIVKEHNAKIRAGNKVENGQIVGAQIAIKFNTEKPS